MKLFGTIIRTISKKTLSILIGFAIAMPSAAFDFESNSLCYRITSESARQAEVVMFSNDAALNSGYYNQASLSIPDTVEHNSVKYVVKAIADSAFHSAKFIKSIVIPASVTSVGNNAFNGCTGFTNVEFTKTPSRCVLGVNTTGETTKGLFYESYLESVTIGRNLIFPANASLTTSPFCDQGRLTEATIEEGVDTVYFYLFKDCKMLFKLKLPSTLKVIADGAFNGCSSIYNLTLPDNVWKIGIASFANCTTLRSINLPSELVRIDAGAFGLCRSIDMIVLPSKLKRIGRQVFHGCESLMSITIPANVDSIGCDLFTNCYKLSSVTISNSTKPLYIGLGNESQYGLLLGIFQTCPLTSVHIGRDLDYSSDASMGYSPFYNQTALSKLTLGPDVTRISNYMFYGASSLKSITLPDKIESIGDYAFFSTGVEGLAIPQKVKKIGSFAFSQCHELSNISFASEACLDTIANCAFRFSGLRRIVLPEGLDAIGNHAFHKCTTLEFVDLPSSLKSMNKSTSEGSFMGCSALTTIINRSSTPICITDNTFNGVNSSCHLLVPNGCKATYSVAANWNWFVIDEFNPLSISTTTIDEDADAPMFDISGRPVSTPRQGQIVVKKGQKMIK